jgi:hypothetical protein
MFIVLGLNILEIMLDAPSLMKLNAAFNPILKISHLPTDASGSWLSGSADIPLKKKNHNPAIIIIASALIAAIQRIFTAWLEFLISSSLFFKK